MTDFKKEKLIKTITAGIRDRRARGLSFSYEKCNKGKFKTVLPLGPCDSPRGRRVGSMVCVDPHCFCFGAGPSGRSNSLYFDVKIRFRRLTECLS